MVLLLAAALLAGCAAPRPRPPQRDPAEVHAQLVSLIPPSTRDRAGWASDIQLAFERIDVPPSTENLCAVLAVIAQESGYVVDPEVPGLARIAREEIDRRAARIHVPRMLVDAALKIDSPDGRSYGERLARVRTEKQLSELFDDLIGRVPLGKRLFGDANPVRTGGPMQVAIAFSERHEKRHPWPDLGTGTVRDAVFTRRGGLHFGIAHLLDYPNAYERHLYRFADFNAGWYASRNAAFQAAVTAATGQALALDGDLVLHGRAREVGATERAVRSLAPRLDMDPAGIRRALESSDSFEFEQGELYRRVFELAERRSGRPLARAVIPRIALESPKFSRKLTTEWFATRVQGRYQRCVNTAFAR
ncbi:MAG: DUF1615 domain-containing protein [Lysobacteraceae bacterium]|nr:MAG: DUF1615 domain-containing protein [Xanthomonadaceae bacterium]